MGNIATPNIIKASDINDLSINSLTTGGDITCNGNISVPSGSVTANQYYGRKFQFTLLIYQSIANSTIGEGTTYNFSNNVSFRNFELLILGIHGPEFPTFVVTPYMIDAYYNSTSYANFICINNIINPIDYRLYVYFPSDTSVHITCPTNSIPYGFYILGLN